jgi:rhomboid protease GluP
VVVYEQIDHTEAREIINFQISYNKRKIKATWVLAVVIAGMYLLEEYFGGSQNMSVLVRMGANVGERVKDGEYYRLMSSVFLHAGFMHVFFNTYVLFALGGFFNRILGESKYLVIFLSSGIVGSLASVYLGKATVSVGASGAIWGLFGASLALAMFPTSLLPEAIRLRLRRITLINLLINLGVSFLPMIDIWAHIGGGVAGFLVSLPIIFRSNSRSLNRVLRSIFAVLAWLLSVVYIIGITYGFYRFEPWVDQLKAELVHYDFADVPFSLDIPKHLAMTAGLDNTKSHASYTFGDPKLDSILIEVDFFHQDMLGHPADKEWLKAQSQQLLSESSVPAKVKKTIYLRDTDGGVLYYQQWPKQEGVVIHNYLFTRESYAIKLSMIVSTQLAQIAVDGLANRIIGNILTK